MHVAFPSVFLFSLAGVCLAVALPLRYCGVKPNPWYGVRFPQSYTSAEHWRQINRRGASLLIGWALSMAALALLFALPVPMSPGIQSVIALVYPLSVFVPVLITYRYARALPPVLDRDDVPPRW